MIRCTICGGGEVVEVALHREFHSAEVFACTACDFFFTHPEPTDEQLAVHYSDSYARVRKNCFGREYFRFMENRASAQADFIEETRGSFIGRTTLDLGCGIGAFVAEAVRRGWIAEGVDWDTEALDIARDRYGVSVSTELDSDRSRAVDLVVLSHVVEHLPNVVTRLRALATGVRAGGAMFVEVPNCTADLVRRTATESHLSFFTRRSLQCLAARAGLEVERIAVCGPPLRVALAAPPTPMRTFLEGLLRGLRLRSGSVYDRGLRHYTTDEDGTWIRALLRVG